MCFVLDKEDRTGTGQGKGLLREMLLDPEEREAGEMSDSDSRDQGELGWTDSQGEHTQISQLSFQG